ERDVGADRTEDGEAGDGARVLRLAGPRADERRELARLVVAAEMTERGERPAVFRRAARAEPRLEERPRKFGEALRIARLLHVRERRVRLFDGRLVQDEEKVLH